MSPLKDHSPIKGFPKSIRLRKRRDFLRVQSSRVRTRSGPFVFTARPLSKNHSFGRIGFTVPKSVGKANLRNLVKRRLRLIARENVSLFGKLDLVIIASPGAAEASFCCAEKHFLRALPRLYAKLSQLRSKIKIYHSAHSEPKKWRSPSTNMSQ